MKNTIILFISFLIWTNCSKNTNRETKTIEITDVLGRKINIPKKIDRIVAVNAGAMRFISYMDAVSVVVGVEDKELTAKRPYNFAFPEIKDKMIIGPQPGGDPELIMKANPQVIFWSYYPTPKGIPDELQNKTGIPVIVIDNGEIGIENEKIYKTLRIIGKVLQREQRAEELIRFIEKNINELKKKISNISDEHKPSVYAGGISFNGPHGILSTRANFTPFTLIKANNVASKMNKKGILNTRPIMIDMEQLIQWNPNYIFIDSEGWKIAHQEMKKGKILYNQLQAVKKNNIYIIPRYINNSFSYDYILIDAWYIAKVLYPEHFSDTNMEKKSLEILEKFYNKKLDLKDFDIEYKQLSHKDY